MHENGLFPVCIGRFLSLGNQISGLYNYMFLCLQYKCLISYLFRFIRVTKLVSIQNIHIHIFVLANVAYHKTLIAVNISVREPYT